MQWKRSGEVRRARTCGEVHSTFGTIRQGMRDRRVALDLSLRIRLYHKSLQECGGQAGRDLRKEACDIAYHRLRRRIQHEKCFPLWQRRIFFPCGVLLEGVTMTMQSVSRLRDWDDGMKFIMRQAGPRACGRGERVRRGRAIAGTRKRRVERTLEQKRSRSFSVPCSRCSGAAAPSIPCHLQPQSGSPL
jgi:hypothetical protein